MVIQSVMLIIGLDLLIVVTCNKMKKFIFDPEKYREAPIYSIVVEAIKDARKQYYYSRSRELGKKEIDFAADYVEYRLGKTLGLQLSDVIIKKCQTVDDIVNYVNLVRRMYGQGFYFDKTIMRK